MKILKGEILKKSKKYKFYTFVSDDVLIEITFEEMGEYLINGDIINIQVDINNNFSNFVDRITNKYFEELKMFECTKERFKGYVFAENPNGYYVSYKGFKCFLPTNSSVYGIDDKFSISKEILHKELEFEVHKIINKSVFLTRKKIDKEEKKLETDEEIRELKVRDRFYAKFHTAQPYGLFLRKEKSEGLLHITQTFYFVKTEKLIDKVKIFYSNLMNKVFCEGDELFVEIIDIKEGKYSLSWDIEHKQNTEYWEKIVKIINEGEKYLALKNNYYPKNEEINNLGVGLSFKGQIKNIKSYGLFIKKSNITGLLHIDNMELDTENNNTEIKNYLKLKYKIGDLIDVEISEINDDKISLKTTRTPHNLAANRLI